MKSSSMKVALALVWGLMLLFVGSVTAQQATAQQNQKAERMTQDLRKQLDLSDEQVNQVAAINRRSVQEMEQVREMKTLSRQERQEQMQRIQTLRTAQIRALLNEQQRSKFEEHQRVQQKKHPRQNQSDTKQRSGRRGGN